MQSLKRDIIDITILVADASDSCCYLLTEILEDTGIAIIRARNGSDALKICSENNRISMVLMDVMLPGMDGTDLINAIRKTGNDIIIIVITSLIHESIRKKCYNAGCDDFITKPIETEGFADYITGWFARE